MITSFKGKYSFLSNMYVLPNGFTTEHYYQASKCMTNKDSAWIMNSTNGYEAKQRGKKIKLRPDWNEVKYYIMFTIVLDKFLDFPELGNLLLDTGNEEIIEQNTWNDTYWGVNSKGIGQNNLGKILMTVRNQI